MNKRIPPYKLAASVVCGNMLDIAHDLSLLKKGGVDTLHFDVMDGHFVPRLGLLPEMLTAIKAHSDLPVDIHLMIEHPEKYIPLFCQSPKDIVVVHAESTQHLDHAIRMIRSHGSRAGVALNPATPLNVLDYIMNEIDLVMLMCINPGIVGHKLIPHMLKKIEDLKKKTQNREDLIIEIDGGVSPESAAEMVRRGANLLVCGTSILYRQHEPLDEQVEIIRMMIDSQLEAGE